MEEIEHFVERIRADIEAKCGCLVDKKLLRGEDYHLRSHKVFAWIRRVIHGRVVPDRCFPIQAKEEHAIKVGVTDLADNRDDNGWWGEPAVYYYVTEGNSESYNRAVEALSKICRVR